MPEDISQDDIDRLLEDALGGPAPSFDDDEDSNDQNEDVDTSVDSDTDDLDDDLGFDITANIGASVDDDDDGGTQSQDDIDALLNAGLPGSEDDASPDDDGGTQSQDDIDALLNAGLPGSEDDASPDDDGGTQSQDDIDALLNAGLQGSEDDASSDDDDGTQSQDDIDALLAGVGGGDDDVTAEEDGAQSQDDIDSLLDTALGIGDEEPSAQPPVVTEEEDSADEDGYQSQDDIDALLSGAMLAEDESASDGSAVDEQSDDGTQDQDSIDDLLSGALGADDEADDAEDDGGTQSQDDIDALLAGAGDEDTENVPEPEDAAEETDTSDEASEQDSVDALLAGMGEDNDTPASDDMDTIKDIPEAAALVDIDAPEDETPAAEEEPDDFGEEALAEMPQDLPLSDESEDKATREQPVPALGVSDFGDDGSDILASALGEAEDVERDIAALEQADADESPLPDEEPDDFDEEPSTRETTSVKTRRQPVDEKDHSRIQEDIASIRESLSMMESGSEIEGITGEIAGLLGQLSERARRYQHTAQTSQHDVNDFKAKLRASERRVSVLNSEKGLLQEELLELRSRLNAMEKEHLDTVETTQSEISTLKVQVRERDNRVRQLDGQVETLTQELDELRQSLTQMEVATRKAQFEKERAGNDLHAERQERARLQRALEAREKELQAIQAHAAGEASTLFIDELHRLVRRYESELNVCTGAARDALAALEKMPGDMMDERLYQMLQDNLRTAAALDESTDTLGRLNRASDSPAASRYDRGDGAVGEVAVSLDDLVLDLEALELQGASSKASTLLARKNATPGQVMEAVYTCDALRSSRVVNQMKSLVSILRKVHEAQHADDVKMGREGPDTDRLYVQMFDFLHQLVRLKAISKATPDAWQFFLNIRGRYSFITSDSQWTGYKKKVLGS